MLACVTSAEEISQNPTNNSPAKQLFSFAKGPRFLHYRKPYNSTVAYDKASSFSNSKVFGTTNGFGVASRPELFP